MYRQYGIYTITGQERVCQSIGKVVILCSVHQHNTLACSSLSLASIVFCLCVFGRVLYTGGKLGHVANMQTSLNQRLAASVYCILVVSVFCVLLFKLCIVLEIYGKLHL